MSFSPVNSTGIVSATPRPTGAAGLAIDNNAIATATLIANLQSAVTAANAAITALQTATPSTISGSITESQVTGLTGHLAAKLPLTGGALTGSLSVKSLSLLDDGTGSTGIHDAVNFVPVYSSDSTAIGLLNGSMSVSLTTYIFGFNGNSVALNTGSGSGGSDLLMDGGSIRAANNIVASAFWSGSNQGITRTLSWLDSNGVTHSLSIENGIIIDASAN